MLEMLENNKRNWKNVTQKQMCVIEEKINSFNENMAFFSKHSYEILDLDPNNIYIFFDSAPQSQISTYYGNY